MSDCIFCRISAGEIPAQIVHQDEDVVAFRDLNPQAPTHVLVIPRKHIATVNDLAADDQSLLGRIWIGIPKVAALLGIGDSGYRVVANCLEPAGQSVFHLHFHILGGRHMGWPPG